MYVRKEMPKFYQELNMINKELINGYNIKLHNFNEGVETMKKINFIIQKASRLRGKYMFNIYHTVFFEIILLQLERNRQIL